MAGVTVWPWRARAADVSSRVNQGRVSLGSAGRQVLRRKVESDSLSVVVPIYNEEENISPLLEQLQKAVKDWPGEVNFS